MSEVELVDLDKMAGARGLLLLWSDRGGAVGGGEGIVKTFFSGRFLLGVVKSS